MNDPKDHIEELFQDRFDGFEADVNPEIWQQVSQQIGTTPTGLEGGAQAASSGSGALGVGAAKLAVITGVVSMSVLGGVYLFSGDDAEVAEAVAPVEETISEEQAAPVMEDVKQADEIVNTQPQIEESDVLPEERTVTFAPQESSSASTTTEQVVEMVREESTTETIQNEDVAQEATSTDAQNVVQEAPTKVSEEAAAVEERSPEAKIEKIERPFEASINASMNRGGNPLSVQFSNRGSLANDMRWDFGDGSEVSQSQSPFHTYNESGDYQVILTMKNSKGQHAIDTMTISVRGTATINAPNLITPNGDLVNDVFMVETENIKSLKCQIFDRSGRLIYQWNQIYGHWDGRDLNGEQVNSGTYFYAIQAESEDGEPITKKGMVQVYR